MLLWRFFRTSSLDSKYCLPNKARSSALHCRMRPNFNRDNPCNLYGLTTAVFGCRFMINQAGIAGASLFIRGMKTLVAMVGSVSKSVSG